jgi:hypothetical protein
MRAVRFPQYGWEWARWPEIAETDADLIAGSFALPDAARTDIST